MLEYLLEKIRDYKTAFLLVLAGLAFALSFLFFNKPSPKVEDKSVSLTSQTAPSAVLEKEQETGEDKASDKGAGPIMVDVKGAVNKPGLYKLSAQSRVDDAIKAAGGMTADADPKSVNLAQKLTDEGIIYVATGSEEVSLIPKSEASTASSGEGATAGSQASSDENGAKINLNTATAQELQTISGIGEKRAQDIINYRETNGAFKSVDDLTNVSGIGKKTLENLRAYVTVD